MTTTTRQAGGAAQRRIKLASLYRAAARYQAAGRLGTAEAIRAQVTRLEATEAELWLVFDPPQVDQLLSMQ
jgi:hypothetical protein